MQKVPDESESQYWDDATIEEAISRHQQMLETLTMTFLYRITDSDIIDKMPRPIRFLIIVAKILLFHRAIASYIADAAKPKFPNDWTSLVGGFLVLRFLD